MMKQFCNQLLIQNLNKNQSNNSFLKLYKLHEIHQVMIMLKFENNQIQETF